MKKNLSGRQFKPQCLCDDPKGGHAIDCAFYVAPKDNWEEEWKSLQNKFYPGDRMNYLTTEQVADIDRLLRVQKKECNREWRERITNSLTPHEYVSDDPKIERIIQDEKLKKLKALLK